MNKILSWLSLLTLIYGFSSESIASAWKLELDEESIQVYTRTTTENDFVEFKGVTKLKTSLNSIVSLLEDTDACIQWVYKCINEQTLKIISPSEKYDYLLFDGSPLSDRDSIVHITRTQDIKSKTVTFTITGVPDFIPEKQDIVRVPMINESWTLEPDNNGNTIITLKNISNPGGIIPYFITNYYGIYTPFNTILKLRILVINKKYKNAKNLVDELEQLNNEPSNLAVHKIGSVALTVKQSPISE